jgi:hypothetical protein
MEPQPFEPKTNGSGRACRWRTLRASDREAGEVWNARLLHPDCRWMTLRLATTP